MKRSILIAFAALLALTQAQSQGPEVVIKYHNTTNCSGGEETEVRTRSRLCNIVPGSPNRSGYTVICNSQGNGGEARFCNDTTCNNCPGRFTFQDNQCTAIDPSYGSSAAQFDCKGGDNSGAEPVALGALSLGVLGAFIANFLRD